MKTTHQALASLIGLIERLQDNAGDGQALQAILRQSGTGAAYEAAQATLAADSALSCKIAVRIEDGDVQIVSNRPVQAVLVDFDIDGCSESRPRSELKFIAASNAQAYVSPMHIRQDAQVCKALFAHVSAPAALDRPVQDLVVRDGAAFAEDFPVHAAVLTPEAAALDEAALGDWFEQQIMSGDIELGSIPALLARYALAQPGEVRMELVKSMSEYQAAPAPAAPKDF